MLAAFPAPSHYLNQCCIIVNWTLMNNKISQIALELRTFSFKITHLKISSENIGHLVSASMLKGACGSCRDSDQDTTLRASHLHNARATILNPFHNIEWKMIEKIGQNKTGLEADIPCIKVTPKWYNALDAAIVYVSNDVTIPFNPMTSQSQRKDTYTYCERTWMGLNSFWNLRIDAWTWLYFFMYRG